MSGWLALGLAAAGALYGIYQFGLLVSDTAASEAFAIASLVMASIAATLLLSGLYTLQPNEGAAILLFGAYKGTDRVNGLRWVWPWYQRKKVSLRVRNETSQTLKVNDRGGNPIEIAAVVVWRVVDTGQALFDVDAYQSFVTIQIETALREIASHFAYDHAQEHEPTLRADGDKVAALLREKLQERVAVAGVVVDEAKLSHLAYAPEIASAMLRRQQAEAILAARQKIVHGAVSMVEDALNDLAERKVVALDDDRRAAMVSNLLVVLCADREATPVINTGTLYG
jgi:regulator of protease activity HflC (stomatin/prohibitin superfamily)